MRDCACDACAPAGAGLPEVRSSRRALRGAWPTDSGSQGATKRWPRFRDRRVATRWSPLGEREQSGNPNSDDGFPITWKALRSETGQRYELRHSIRLFGSTKIAETVINVLAVHTTDVDEEEAEPVCEPSKGAVVEKPVAGLSVADSTTADPCCESCGGDALGWVRDAAHAMGVHQFRFSSWGELRGGTPSGRNVFGRQIIGLHDDGIDRDAPIFYSRTDETDWRIVDYWTWGCVQEEALRAEYEGGLWEIDRGLNEVPEPGRPVWLPKMPDIDTGHSHGMAHVAVGDGELESSFSDGGTDSRRITGMAPYAGIYILGTDADPACTRTEDEVCYPKSRTDDAMWKRKTGPQAVRWAAERGVDLFLSANSQYLRCPSNEASACSLNEDTNHDIGSGCNYWRKDHVKGRGRLFADAIDERFQESNLLSILSAGNVSASTSAYYSGSPPCDPAEDLYAIPLGRSAYTAIPVGGIELQTVGGDCGQASYCTATTLDFPTLFERIAMAQMSATPDGSMGTMLAGPMGDGRVYPLILGFASMCGVLNTSAPDSYGQFRGTSAASASIAGSAIVLREWLQKELTSTWSDNPAMLRMHLLNMGDRLGGSMKCNTYLTDGANAAQFPDLRHREQEFADHGLFRHGGFGKLRLRLVDACHWNDGELMYVAWRVNSPGEVYTLELDGTEFSGQRALPADLGRIRVAFWFELDTSVTKADDRPRAVLYLERRGTGGEPWAIVLRTSTSEEYEPLYGTRSPLAEPLEEFDRDPHASLALDREWGTFSEPSMLAGGEWVYETKDYSIEGGYEYRIRVMCPSLPGGVARTAHMSVLWETGDDASLAYNRDGSWECESVRSASSEVTDPKAGQARRSSLDDSVWM